jgi:hypothetical protein
MNRLLIIMLFSICFLTSVRAEPVQVSINVHPGSDPNSVKSTARGVIPIAILGSDTLDVTTIDTYSLQLKLGENLILASGADPLVFQTSKVEDGRRSDLLCDITDIGSYDAAAFDHLGEPDHYPDLICQFGKDITLILGVSQRVRLTGYFYGGAMLYGDDFASEPTQLNDEVLCCIDCEGEAGDETCGGCNKDIYPCTNLLKSCSNHETSSPDASGCGDPRIAQSDPVIFPMIACDASAREYSQNLLSGGGHPDQR